VGCPEIVTERFTMGLKASQSAGTSMALMLADFFRVSLVITIRFKTSPK